MKQVTLTEWHTMPPKWRDVVVLVRDIPGEFGPGLCCWDSTAHGWVIHWMLSDKTEQYADDAAFPSDYRWAVLPKLDNARTAQEDS